MSTSTGPKPSLVDIAEEALRSWLATGRHRPGERLPPEQELSAHLGISRGTLRTALQRLEDSGEIVRRQGSGTYVGRAVSTSLDEGLEKLVSYSALARERGVKLEVGDLTVEERPCRPETAETFGVPAETPAVQITRVLLMDGEPGAWMRDVVHPRRRAPITEPNQSADGEGRNGAGPAAERRNPSGLHPSPHHSPSPHQARPNRKSPRGRRTSSRPRNRPRDLHSRRRRPWSTATTSSCPRSLDLHVMRWLRGHAAGAGDRAGCETMSVC